MFLLCNLRELSEIKVFLLFSAGKKLHLPSNCENPEVKAVTAFSMTRPSRFFRHSCVFSTMLCLIRREEVSSLIFQNFSSLVLLQYVEVVAFTNPRQKWQAHFRVDFATH